MLLLVANRLCQSKLRKRHPNAARPGGSLRSTPATHHSFSPQAPGAVYNGLAWLYATVSNEDYRNGDKAVENATKACELTDWENDSYVGTLAAAYAEKGDYEQATKWLKKAIELGPDNNVEVRKEMLELFEAGKPYRAE